MAASSKTTVDRPHLKGIIYPDEFDPSLLKFDTARDSKAGGVSVGMLYDGAPLRFKLPALLCPFGLAPSKDKEGKLRADKYGNLSYKMQVAVDKLQSGGEDLFVMLEELRRLTAEEFQRESLSWTGEEDVSSEMALRSVGELLKYSKDPKTKKINPKYPPSMAMKVPQKVTRGNDIFEKEFTVTCDIRQSGRRRRVELSTDNYEQYVPRFCTVEGIVLCRGIYIASKTIYVTFAPEYLLVQHNERRLTEDQISTLFPMGADEDDEVDRTNSRAITDADDDEVGGIPAHNEATDELNGEANVEDDERDEREFLRNKRPRTPSPEPVIEPEPPVSAPKPISSRGRKRPQDDQLDDPKRRRA